LDLTHLRCHNIVFSITAAQGAASSGFLFDAIGTPYPDAVDHAALRLVSAVAGALLVPLCWGVLSRLGHGPLARVAAGVMLSLDNALVTSSRLIMLDAPLLLFIMAALYFALRVRVQATTSSSSSYNSSSSNNNNSSSNGSDVVGGDSKARAPATPPPQSSLRHLPSSEFGMGTLSSLFAAGLALGCAASVKLVGLGIASLVGMHAAAQLWEVWGQWQHPVGRFIKHTAVRFILLACLPVVVYLALFVLHVRLVPNTGPGDGFVSRRFQESIRGNGFAAAASVGAHHTLQLQPHSTVTIRRMYGDECWLTVATPSLASSALMNSSDYDGDPTNQHQGFLIRCVAARTVDSSRSSSSSSSRSSSSSSQSDEAPLLSSLWWELVSAPGASHSGPSHGGGGGGESGLQHGAETVLRHVATGAFLSPTTALGISGGTDGHAGSTKPPLEVSALSASSINGTWNGTSGLQGSLWRIDILGQDSTVLYVSKSLVRFVHIASGGALQCTNAAVVQRGQPTVFPCLAGANIQDTTGGWHFDRARLPHANRGGVDNGPEQGDGATGADGGDTRMTDFEKVTELHSTIFARNNELSGQHRYGSRPWEWPMLHRGISFWHNDAINRPRRGCGRQVYLLGNPAVWWMGTAAVPIYILLVSFWAVRIKRGVHDLSAQEHAWAKTSGWLLTAGWGVHYIPFFFFGRLLFLHHYLPALCFSVMLAATLLERVLLAVAGRYATHALAAWIAVVAWCFISLAPLTYGDELCNDELKVKQWVTSWDFHFFDDVPVSDA
jgi:hypothetical protein